MDSHHANDTVECGLANERWLTIYKYYLMAAIAFGVIGLAKFASFYSGEHLVGQSVWFVARIGLFAFTLWSLSRVGKGWVRALQLSINGIAVIMVVSGLPDIFTDDIFKNAGSLTVFPIRAVVPWGVVYELQLVSLFLWVTDVLKFAFPAYFFFRWLVRPAPAQSPAWRKYRIWAGILAVLLGCHIAIFGLAVAQQMSFLSGVLSGLGPSGVSIPLPVVAMVLGIVIGGLMFCGEQGRGRPMIWLAAVIAPLFSISVIHNRGIILIVLAVSAYLIWVLRNTVRTKESR